MHPAPAIHNIKSLDLIEPVRHTLDNGTPLYEIAMGSQDILHIEMIWEAGRWYEHQPLVSRATAKMLRLGTLRHNAEAIADYFDFYGTKLSVDDDFDTVRLNVYCLTKHLEPLLQMLQEILTESAFPDDELEKYIKRQKQKLKLQLQEGDTVAYRTLTETLYGKGHPYGYNSSPEQYDALNTDLLRNFYRQHFGADRCLIMVAGKSDAKVLALINRYLGQLPQAVSTPVTPIIPTLPAIIPAQIHLPAPKQPSLQSSLRIGRRIINRQHPDFHALGILNTILGGYFGARLMQNLREENGYTYGIYSSIETARHENYLYISTEVGNEVKQAALTEIYSEIERLKEEPVDEEELGMVRSYLMGMLLNSLDGAFKIAAIWRELLTADLSAAFFKNYVDTLQNITPAHLQQLAQEHLRDWCEVTVG